MLLREMDFGIVHRVRLKGELDRAAADDAGTVIAAALETSPSVQVDLSALTSIGAHGARTLVTLYKRSRSMGKILTFFPGPPNVQKVFEAVSSVQPLPF